MNTSDSRKSAPTAPAPTSSIATLAEANWRLPARARVIIGFLP
jgi:hypothetical protein